MQLTVKQYASKFKISVQAVYQKLQRGTLQYIEEEGIKYIVLDKQEIKDIEQPLVKEVEREGAEITQGIVKDLLKQLKQKDKEFKKMLASKDKEIRRLSKKLEKSSDKKEEVYLSYISELKQLQISSKPSESIIDIEEDNPKKKKKKKKR